MGQDFLFLSCRLGERALPLISFPLMLPPFLDRGNSRVHRTRANVVSLWSLSGTSWCLWANYKPLCSSHYAMCIMQVDDATCLAGVPVCEVPSTPARGSDRATGCVCKRWLQPVADSHSWWRNLTAAQEPLSCQRRQNQLRATEPGYISPPDPGMGYL